MRWPGPRAARRSDVTVVILDRPRHAAAHAEVRAAGARIKFITDGDVAGAIMAVRAGTGVDLLLGIGGTPEGIISACAIKCLGGVIQGKLCAEGRGRAGQARSPPATTSPRADHGRPGHRRQVLRRDTGITDGELVGGVHYRAGGAVTHSLVMRARSGTVRSIHCEHQLSKLRAYSSVELRLTAD